MDFQDEDHFSLDHNEPAMSPDSSKPKLQLPLSCDPPGPSNGPKQLVWIVSADFSCWISYRDEVKVNRKPDNTASALSPGSTKKNIRPETNTNAYLHDI